MFIGLHVKYPLFWSDFNETPIFTRDFKKNTQISNFTKLQREPNRFVRTQGQAELTKLIVAFRNFVKAPKNEEDRIFITSPALVSQPRGSSAHNVFITDCCKVKNMKLEVSSNDTISVPSLVKIDATVHTLRSVGTTW